MPYADVNGQHLYYEDTGGDGPVVVFSHGLMMDHEMFAPQVAALRDRYRCITWDERGHGLTASDELPPFTYYDSADDLAALLDYLGVEEAVLAGMSQGGFLSLRCALTHPDIVRGLVMIDSQAGPELAEKMPAYTQMIDTFVNKGLTPELGNAIAFIILGQNFAQAEEWKEKWRGFKPVNIMGTFQALASRDDITERLPEIDKPTLIVHGDADVAIPLERARVMEEKLPNAHLAVIPGAGHAANLSHPEPVNQALAAFLENVYA
ncbi:alpha/beta fold hydrolase [Mangrovitalea sediminis]|uniref:alpha/beta fold hydrolase n=1 Tax=Mangrovitalea sediminis TaxID=1982043 RepID=UPI000BE5870B|nr:alpha/beta hydrolase [Mangrovitalea sediminis]